jgi:hypothetical protein
MNVLRRLLAEANIIIAACSSATIDDLCHTFKSTMVIVNDCNLAWNLKTCVPLILYEDVRIRP